MIWLLAAILLLEMIQLLLLFVTFVFIAGTQTTGEAISRAFQKQGQINLRGRRNDDLNEAKFPANDIVAANQRMEAKRRNSHANVEGAL
jgi:hypothetical protein